MKRLLCLFIVLLSIIHVIAQDEAAPTCPNEAGVYYQANLFPRYEAHNQRVVLVDWSTGAEIRVLATGIVGNDYRLQSWSPECQYLVMAFSKQDANGVELWDSYVWDVLSGQQIAVFSDARLSQFPITWDTNSSRLLVETRFGAYLWYFDGSEVWLTSEADYNARSFRAGTLNWDYANNQLSATLNISPLGGTAVYDMSSGELLRLTNQSGTELDPTTYLDTQANETGERYPCRSNGYSYSYDNTQLYFDAANSRLVLRDSGTHELWRVIDENLGDELVDTRFGGGAFYGVCRYLWVTFGRYGTNHFVYDLSNNQRVLSLQGYVHQRGADPTGTYLIVTDSAGANLYHLPSGRVTPLIPNVRVSNLGSGSVWAYDTIEWDLANNRVRLGSTETSWIHSYTIFRIYIFDLNTGSLVEILDQNNQSLDTETVIATDVQRNAPYGCRWYVDYQSQNQQVVLLGRWGRERLAVLQDNLVTQEFRTIAVSPDCRYVAAAVWSGSAYDTYVWDLTALNQPLIFPDAQETWHVINFSPYGGYAIVHTRNGGFLWHLPTDSRVQLNTGVFNDNQSTHSRPRIYNFHHLQWDMTGGQFLAVPIEHPDTVIAYDLATGNPVGEYHVAGRAAPVDFIQIDANRLLVFTDYSGREEDHRANGLALWNRQTNTGIQLAMDFYVMPRAGNLYSRGYPQFSPDGSLMMMHSATYVYIWDLNALSGAEPYLPNYVHQLASAADVHFLDNNTIQSVENTTTQEQSSRRIRELTYYTYDVRTGALLEERVESQRYNRGGY